jgi:4-hydroxybenzoyl-CoA reductase subunit beta
MTLQLPIFQYANPTTVEEAVALLGESGEGAMIVGGGTDLIPKMKRRQTAPATLISLAGIEELSGIRIDDEDNCVIGASTTLREIADSSLAPRVVAAAAKVIASPQIRNTATIGGNLCLDTRCNYIDQPDTWRQASGYCLKDGGDTCWVAPKRDRCWAISSTDLAPVAIALSGSVTLASPRGERVVAVEDLYRDDGIDRINMERDEILVELALPPFTGRATYEKLARRGAIDFPLLGVAAAIDIDDGGVCRSARIAVGGIAPAPLRATKAEDHLVGRALTSDTIEEAARLGAHPFRPQDNTDMGSRYRKWMISVHIAKALETCLREESV